MLQVMDKHMRILALQHMETKFIKVSIRVRGPVAQACASFRLPLYQAASMLYADRR